EHRAWEIIVAPLVRAPISLPPQRLALIVARGSQCAGPVAGNRAGVSVGKTDHEYPSLAMISCHLARLLTDGSAPGFYICRADFDGVGEGLDKSRLPEQQRAARVAEHVCRATVGSEAAIGRALWIPIIILVAEIVAHIAVA